MVTFTVSPSRNAGCGVAEPFSFSVSQRMALLAGSRRLSLPQAVCRDLLHQLAYQGFHFYTGCAPGVDASFRQALITEDYSDKAFVACAFPGRMRTARSQGLFAQVGVPPGVPPKVALARRTLWMVKRSALVVLFPETPGTRTWGPGSKLVFRSALHNLKPMFVVSASAPHTELAPVMPANLFGVVDGWWVVPHPQSPGGLVDELP